MGFSTLSVPIAALALLLAAHAGHGRPGGHARAAAAKPAATPTPWSEQVGHIVSAPLRCTRALVLGAAECRDGNGAHVLLTVPPSRAADFPILVTGSANALTFTADAVTSAGTVRATFLHLGISSAGVLRVGLTGEPISDAPEAYLRRVRTIVGERADLIAGCYEARLASRPRLAGVLYLRLKIAATGGAPVIATITASTMGDSSGFAPDRSLEACVSGVFARISFPRPPRGATSIEWPLRFSPDPMPGGTSLAFHPGAPQGRIRTDDPILGGSPGTGGGSLPPTVIRSVVDRHRSGLQYCYERELTRKPALAGDVTMRFTIGANGSVTDATAESGTLDDANTEECLTRQFLLMQFPRPYDGGVVVVKYPLRFTSASGQSR